MPKSLMLEKMQQETIDNKIQIYGFIPNQKGKHYFRLQLMFFTRYIRQWLDN